MLLVTDVVDRLLEWPRFSTSPCIPKEFIPTPESKLAL